MTVMPEAEELTEGERKVLERRARILSAHAAQEQGEDRWIAEFRVGDARYAIRLESLRATLPLRAVTPIPLSAPHILGVLRFQGQIISALSLSALLGGRGWKVDPSVLLVVDPGWGVLVAVDCEQIPKVIAVPPAALDAAAAGADGPVAELDFDGGPKVKLIDLGSLLDRRAGARRAR